MGARKITFVGYPPIGCIPSQRTLGGGIERACEPKRNQAAQLFNSKVAKEIDRLGRQYKGVQNLQIVYVDIYNMLIDLIFQPSKYGNSIFTSLHLSWFSPRHGLIRTLNSIPIQNKTHDNIIETEALPKLGSWEASIKIDRENLFFLWKSQFSVCLFD